MSTGESKITSNANIGVLKKTLILGGKRKENITDRYVCFQAAVLSMHFIFVFCV